MADQETTKRAQSHSDRTKTLLRTAVAVAAISIPLIQTNYSDAARFARRGGFRPAPAFHRNFHPHFRGNFHPPFHNFYRFHHGFNYHNDRFQPQFRLNFNYGYNGYDLYQPYTYSYPAYSYPSYTYSYPAYSYPAQTYASPQLYAPQTQAYVAAGSPAAEAPLSYQSQVSSAYAPQTASGPIILTYPNLQVIFPGRTTTLSDVENMYASGKLTYSEEQRVISDMHLNPTPAISASGATTTQPSVNVGGIASAKRLLAGGYITEKQYAEILAKKTLESDAAKLYADGSFTEAEYESMLAKIKGMPTNGQASGGAPGHAEQSK